MAAPDKERLYAIIVAGMKIEDEQPWLSALASIQLGLELELRRRLDGSQG
jgi:hypothetical protein